MAPHAPACYLLVVCMPRACRLSVVCLSSVGPLSCRLSVICLPSVCRLSVVCLSSVARISSHVHSARAVCIPNAHTWLGDVSIWWPFVNSRLK